MKIVNLIEDTPVENGLKYEHGLSFYIETNKHKILFDTGASDAFIYNANRLDIDLKDVDIVVLSHGHYDHCGGVMKFAEINKKANIYIQQSARGDYYNLKNNIEKYIGIDKSIMSLERLKVLDGNYKIDDELFLLAGIKYKEGSFVSNSFLKEKIDDEFVQDKFVHEQYLVIKEANKCVLISGCAHNGIVNILNKYNEYDFETPKAVFSGFHLIKDGLYNNDEINTIKNMAKELNTMDTIFYTGHCTGEQAIDIIKPIMKDKLVQIHSGDIYYI